MTLEGQVAVVTGAARGIGAAIASRLARDGADIAVLDQEPSDRSVAAIEALGRRAFGLVTDVSVAADVRDAAREVEAALGPATIIVNNAGIIIRKAALDYTDEDFDRTIRVNLLGQWHVTHHFAKRLAEIGSPGAVVNIASATALIATYGRAPYIASKAGVVGLTKALALDLAEYDIRVNCVVPGATETEIWADYQDDPQVYQQNLLLTPLRRWGQPEDVAAGVAYLVSDEAAHVTGTVLAVDGGTSAGSPGGMRWPELRDVRPRPRRLRRPRESRMA